MFTYFKMKKMQWRVKIALYDAVLGFMDNKRDIMNTAKKLFDSVKDVPAEDIRDEFIGKLAEIVHEEAEANKINSKAKMSK
ncbi:MAG: hypothetical protein HDT46_10620 [Ruminococcaceae bacterium]|nr:hypothetical protein [Oscillospiraceae bacterium]